MHLTQYRCISSEFLAHPEVGEEGDAKEDENAEQAADRRAKKFREEWQSAPDDAPDPDGFVPQQGSNLPRDHELASDHAEECLLDSVRTLLCLHYEARLRDADRARRKRKAEEEEQGGAGEEKEDFRIEPAGGCTLGAYVRGLSCSSELSATAEKRLREAFLKYSVLIFEGQHKLTTAQQAGFAERHSTTEQMLLVK